MIFLIVDSPMIAQDPETRSVVLPLSMSSTCLLLSLLSFVTLTRVTTGKRKQLEGKEHGK